MARLWLPIGSTPRPRDERGQLIQRLRDIGVTLVGAHDPNVVELGQLREIVHWQEERAAQQAKADLLKPVSKLSRATINATLRDYLEYQRVRKAGGRRLY